MRRRWRRFQREARAASALNHPNICTIYDIRESRGARVHRDGVAGRTDAEALHPAACRWRTGAVCWKWRPRLRRRWKRRTRKGIVHRDIKPANIFVTAARACEDAGFWTGETWRRCRASDGAHGVRSTTDGDIAEAHLTSPGSAMGTVAYMSPEQALGKKLDARTRSVFVWRGAVRDGDGDAAVSRRYLGSDFRRDSARRPDSGGAIESGTAAELERIINKALEKDRELRYQSASDIHADLKRRSPGAAVSRAPAAPA